MGKTVYKVSGTIDTIVIISFSIHFYIQHLRENVKAGRPLGEAGEVSPAGCVWVRDWGDVEYIKPLCCAILCYVVLCCADVLLFFFRFFLDHLQVTWAPMLCYALFSWVQTLAWNFLVYDTPYNDGLMWKISRKYIESWNFTTPPRQILWKVGDERGDPFNMQNWIICRIGNTAASTNEHERCMTWRDFRSDVHCRWLSDGEDFYFRTPSQQTRIIVVREFHF